jgi:hypothetical protein
MAEPGLHDPQASAGLPRAAAPGSPGLAPPAFYAAGRGAWREWWTVLHPPYTAWHLSYVVIGAALAPELRFAPLLATLLAFFLAVGVAAHALDELRGRPLRTAIPASHLVAAAGVSLALACGIGVVGVTRLGPLLVPFIVVGAVLVVTYDLELMGGLLHNDAGFAAAWGAFPVLTAYFAQTGTLGPAALAGAAGAFALSWAQRRLSAPARRLRRRTLTVSGELVGVDGHRQAIDRELLLAPLEGALKALCWAVVALAAAMAITRAWP